jgi:hypothetical protein
VRCIVPHDAGIEAKLADAFRVTTTTTRAGERLPAPLWPICAPSPTADELSKRIKHTFDPDALLNPGIFGEVA